MNLRSLTAKETLKEIKSVMVLRNNNFYSDSIILDSIEDYFKQNDLNELHPGSKSWKVAKSQDFKKDLKALSVKELCDKYDVSYGTVYYHRSKK